MELKRFGVSIPEDLLHQFDEIVERRGYVGRSEAIRDAMRLYISDSQWESGDEVLGAALNVVYEHRPKLMSEMVAAQHAARATVISTIHVHLTLSRCFEVIVIQGKREEIQDLADKISGLAGIQYVRIFTFSLPSPMEESHHHSP
ncbi:MAG: nickel-responsive transcriptional regulator NikR [Candidatus Thorarchaeota archaeon]|nr:nickel-responsive transcriptional regulator NikR [Candidatus Thorarchaeota archaeon]